MKAPPPFVSEHGKGGGFLKATPGKTPLPPKTVLPPVPPKTKRPSYTAAQEATLHAKALLAPQYAQADTEAARQNKAIQAYTTAVMQQLAGLAPAVGQPYAQAANAQEGMVNAASDSLRAVNPSGDVAKLLDAVGAPQAQNQQIQGNLNNTFNGGAAVGQYMGALPIGTIRSEGANAEALARLQPGFTALAGRQSLLSALAQQSDARAQIGAQLPKLSQDWLTSFQSNKNAQSQLALEAQAAGLKQANTDRSFAAQQAKYISDYNLRVKEFNAKQTSAATKAAAPSASLSRANGFLTDASGNAILDSKGKRQILPGFNVNAQGRVVKVGKAGSKTGGASTAQVNSFLKTVSTPTYATVRKTKDGKSVSVKVKTGSTFNVQYGQAYKRLRAMGLDDKTARENLNSIYRRGQGGRSWLSNEEQSLLKGKVYGPRAKLVFTIRDKQGVVHGYIPSSSAELLRQAHLLPEGEQGTVRGRPVYYIKPTY